jgi:hypothetical protein
MEAALGVKWHGREYIRQVERTAEQKLSAFCNRICDDIKRDMAKPKSGKPGKNTTASAPGESPARQTGLLVRSIVHKRSGKMREKLGTGIKYGLYLELSTKKMAARPWLRPALSRARANFRQLWKDK